MSSDREVVITGVGVVTPIGIGTDVFWQALVDGKSGVERRELFADSDIPIKLAATVKEFDPRKFIKPRKAIKIMCAPIQYGCAAAAMAVEQANLMDGNTPPEKIGTLFGAETYYADPSEVCNVFSHCVVDDNYVHDRWGEFAMKQIAPLWMLKYLPNMAASHISIAIDARGASNTICQADCSSQLAMIEAVSYVQRGLCDAVVTGGTGSVCELASVLYRGNEGTSQFAGDPALASRPFNAERDGVVLGEGSGAIVIETAENAARRGATPLAKIAGWSRIFNRPESESMIEGIEYCYRKSLESAGVEPSDIDWINANADGSAEGDVEEAQAIQRVFGDTPVVAHKGNFGHLGPGTGAVELVGAVLSMKHRLLPASLNSENLDSDCPVTVNTANSDLAADKQLSVLKSSFAKTGQITSLILQSC